LNTATAKNPVLHKYEVANGINTRKALFLTPGHSAFMLFQNRKSDRAENLIDNEESDEVYIN